MLVLGPNSWCHTLGPGPYVRLLSDNSGTYESIPEVQNRRHTFRPEYPICQNRQKDTTLANDFRKTDKTARFENPGFPENVGRLDGRMVLFDTFRTEMSETA